VYIYIYIYIYIQCASAVAATVAATVPTSAWGNHGHWCLHPHVKRTVWVAPKAIHLGCKLVNLQYWNELQGCKLANYQLNWLKDVNLWDWNHIFHNLVAPKGTSGYALHAYTWSEVKESSCGLSYALDWEIEFDFYFASSELLWCEFKARPPAPPWSLLISQRLVL